MRSEAMKGWNRWVMAAAVLTLSCQGAGAPEGAQGAAPPAAAWHALSPDQAKALLGRTPQALVLDVRDRSEWDDDLGHIQGARQIPVQELSQRLGELAEFKHRPVVVVCRVGGRSADAAQTLAAAGFREVYNLEGGMLAWRHEGY